MVKTNELAAWLLERDDIVVIGHVAPDGDTVGSALAIRRALQKAGKRAIVCSADKMAQMYAFLPGIDEAVTPENLPFTPACILYVDIAAPDRAGDRGAFAHLNLPAAQLDHHGTNPRAYALNVVDAQASATGLLALSLIDDLGVALDEEMGVCLYTAISTDTGNFSFPNTSSEAFEAAARLLATGFDMADANYRLFRMRSLPRIRLLGAALHRLTMHLNNRVAATCVTQQMFDACGATLEHTEGIVNFLSEIQGVEVAIVAEYRQPDQTKFSLRSNGSFDVADVAHSFGGGGHKNAAGMTVMQPVEEAAQTVVRAIMARLGA